MSTANFFFSGGIARLLQGDYVGATEDFTIVIQLDRYNAQAYHGRGRARSYLKDYPGAIQDYDKAIELNGNYAQAY